MVIKALLAVVPPVILNSQRSAREYLVGPGHVQSSDLKRHLALCRVEFDQHDVMLPQRRRNEK